MLNVHGDCYTVLHCMLQEQNTINKTYQDTKLFVINEVVVFQQILPILDALQFTIIIKRSQRRASITSVVICCHCMFVFKSDNFVGHFC